MRDPNRFIRSLLFKLKGYFDRWPSREGELTQQEANILSIVLIIGLSGCAILELTTFLPRAEEAPPPTSLPEVGK